MTTITIAPELVPAVAIAAVTIGVYAARLEHMTWRTHRPACVLAQMVGALAALSVAVAAGIGAPSLLCYAGLVAVGLHVWRTEPAWQASGGPPPETESRPMPLDAG